MKKVILIFTAAALLFAFCSCGKTEEETTVQTAGETQIIEIEDLYGTWITTDFYGADNAKKLLAAMEFDEAEIAFADCEKLGAIKAVTLNSDGSYIFGYDKEETVTLLTSYYNEFIATLFEHRAELTAVYGQEVTDCESLELFKAFYTYIFGASSYDEIIALFIDGTVSDELFETTAETGTFTVEDGCIKLTKTGETTIETIPFAYDSGVLMLAYTNVTESYIKK